MKRYLFLLVFALCVFPCPSVMAADTDKDSEYLGEQFAEVSYYDNNAGGTWIISYYKGRRNEEAYKDFTVYPVVTNNKDYGNWKGENDQCVNLFMTVDSSCTDDFIYITRKDVLVRDGSNKEDSSRWVELKCQLMDYNENIWFNYDSRFPDYLKQFMTEEDKEYSQFATGLNEYIKEQNFRFAVSEFSYDSNLTYTRDWSQSYYTSSYITIYPEGDYVNSLREQGEKVISSQFEGEFRSGTMSGIYTIYNFCIPFLYCNDLITKPPDYNPDGAKPFICYREHIKPIVSLSNTRVGSSVFTWKVSDYPDFSDCYMEIRSTLLEGNQQFGYRLLTDKYFYYSSVDNVEKHCLKVPFSEGTMTCFESAMYDYFKVMDEFKSIAISCPIRFQVRVISDDKTIYSNWVTFDFGVDGQNGWTGVMSDDGEVVTDGINNLPDYDWDSDENAGKYGYVSDSDSDGKITDFSSWLKNALNTVISFPTLLSICYSWLPSEIIRLIGIGIGIIVTLRILGR